MGQPVRCPEQVGVPLRVRALAVFLGVILALVGPSLASAQTATQPAPVARSAAPGKPAAAKNPDKLLVEANELLFDKDKNTVSAVGDAQLYYQGRVLEADKVTYDRNSKRVFAEGHAKLTDEKGDVTYGSRFDLTDNFRDGFIESVQSLETDKTRFTAPRVERTDGLVTTFENGTYTACEPCKDHPEKPPLWQVRAAKIIENSQEHTVYYEDAWLELAGIPVAYIPYFSVPDPTVTRQSGFMMPRFIRDTALGYGVGVGYFWNLAPNYDITFDPTFLTRQGFLADVEWRHRLDNGSYNIRATGIYEQDPSAFLPAPYGAGTRRFRGSLESQGTFFINENWTYGWDVTALSDKYYFDDYKVKAADLSTYYIRDVVSSVYLRGQSDRGFFDLSGYRIQDLTNYSLKDQDPWAVPVFDYHKMIDLPPDRTNGIGGELTFELNATSITRDAAEFQSTGAQTLDRAFSLYNVCETPTGARSYTPATCLLRGIGGNYSRATAQVSWQRKFIDPIGEVWTPFIFARLDGESTNLDTSRTFAFSNGLAYDSFSNSSQPAFFGGLSSETDAHAMPGVGLEYRYPFVSSTRFGTQVLEPIAQVIARPNEVTSKLQPNEDSQSLVFDDTTLFEWNKYSGYDRVEGGGRLNYGLQYVANFVNGGHANFVGGESVQLFGRNSFAVPDAANTGLESGLDKKYSDFVARETISPVSGITFTSKQQFDSVDFALKRLDVLATGVLGPLTATIDYGHYAAQPELGWLYEREGVLTNATYKFADHWKLTGNIILDMSRHLYDLPGEHTSRFLPAGFGVGFGYFDECTTVNVLFSSTTVDPVAATPKYHDETIMVELVLRTLGEARTSAGVSGLLGNQAQP
jgi:LPS-assembly protein